MAAAAVAALVQKVFFFKTMRDYAMVTFRRDQMTDIGLFYFYTTYNIMGDINNMYVYRKNKPN